MDPAASPAQQTLLENPPQNHREAQPGAPPVSPASHPAPTNLAAQSSPVSRSTPEEDKKAASEQDDDFSWVAKQEEYKKGLLQGTVKPPKYKVYDFTKGSENEKRLKSKTYEYVPSGQAADPE